MSRYYAFYGRQLHSEAEQGGLHSLVKGAPEGSVIYDSGSTDMTWFDTHVHRIEEEDVPPILRAMALMLGD